MSERRMPVIKGVGTTDAELSHVEYTSTRSFTNGTIIGTALVVRTCHHEVPYVSFNPASHAAECDVFGDLYRRFLAGEDVDAVEANR